MEQGWEIALIAWTFAGSIMWMYIGGSSLLSVLRLDELGSVDAPPVKVRPLVSIVVPACNEAAALRDAQLSLLGQDYDNFEVILVNDRSTDETGELVDEIAAGDARVRALHIRSLPDGWLGKVNAMHTAAGLARGELILFTDADIVFEPEALRRSVDYFQVHRLDHLAALPRLETDSFWLKLLCNAFGVHFMAGMHRQADPERPEAIGVGAFNMVRRETYVRHGGFERLRLEVADDVGLAKYLAENGARSSIVLAQRMLSVEWYVSVIEMIRGFEKNLFAAVAGFSWLRAALLTLFVVLYSLAPFAGIPVGTPLALLPGVLVAVFLFAGIVVSRRRVIGVGYEAMLMPLGLLTLAVAIANSAWQAWRRKGIVWRGTLYSIAELRRHQYVRMFK